MGTLEALLAGVPMVGIPFFSDQFFNIRNYVEMGIAVRLDFEEISEETFLNAVQLILGNPRYVSLTEFIRTVTWPGKIPNVTQIFVFRYAEKSKYYSELFKDRPQSALDTAIYWTEYVIRHKGAHHLKSSGTKLYWFQYLLLDVALFIILSVVFVTYACKKIVILIVRVL